MKSITFYTIFWIYSAIQVMFFGCIPVLLNDEYDTPFEELIPVSEFVIKWPMRSVDQKLIDYLEGLTPQVINRMTKAMEKYRCTNFFQTMRGQSIKKWWCNAEWGWGPIPIASPFFNRRPKHHRGDQLAIMFIFLCVGVPPAWRWTQRSVWSRDGSLIPSYFSSF